VRAADDSRDKLERGSDITCDFEKVTSSPLFFYFSRGFEKVAPVAVFFCYSRGFEKARCHRFISVGAVMYGDFV
jgi:hypothetical protein